MSDHWTKAGWTWTEPGRPGGNVSTQKKATIYSVASEAGVSIATVSRVLGTRGRVAPTTRRRVEEAAARLNYTPLASARSLASKRHAALGLVVDTTTPAQTITSFTNHAATSSEAVMLVVADGPHDDHQRITRLARRVDGLALVAERDFPADLITELASTCPVVTVGRQSVPGVDAVLANHADMSAQVVDHLVAHGRKHLEFVTGPRTDSAARERYEGFSLALLRAGLPVPHPRVPTWEASDWTIDPLSGIDAVKDADGLICADDVLAVALMAALRQKGMSVPDDLAVVGWGDAPMSRHSWPSLSTVHPPAAEIGQVAALRLQARIQGDGPLEHPILLTHTFLPRDSCGCLAR